ncbi:MAG: thiamine pyrophosphate-binding protein [Patescibacteria group bacterium]
MNVADYIVNFLVKKGVKTIFMLTGGQAMFLNDSVYRHKTITPIFTHHEQAAGMAAEAYGRAYGELGVAMVTAGPAGLNILNGVVGALVDSAPMMVISGQSNSSVIEYMEQNDIRQYGIQGINMAPFGKASTKYFKRVDDPSKIAYYLEEAYYLAMSGRTGPVWIDVPLDIQRMQVPEKLLTHFQPPKETTPQPRSSDINQLLNMLKKAKRPLLLAGQGIKIAHAEKELDELLKLLKAPVITTRLGIDLIDSNNRLFAGRPGLYGDRYANFAVQNADLIIAIGARLDTGLVGYDPKDWGRNAKKVVVDLESSELAKPGVSIDLKIQSDAKVFIAEVLKQGKKIIFPSFSEWVKICNQWKEKYPTTLPEYRQEKLVNTYYFSDVLSDIASNDDSILIDTSSCFHVVCQAWKIKKGQRFMTTGGLSTLGYWPAGLGLAMTSPKKRTIVITGDGSLSMNIQELATIKQNNLPIKLFIFNNNGYLLIRHTQKTHMEGRFMGESPETGLWLPDMLEIAKTYKIKGVRISSSRNLASKLKAVLDYDGPVICDVMTPLWQPIVPRISSYKKPDGTMVSKTYEDMFPFLSRKELMENELGVPPKED